MAFIKLLISVVRSYPGIFLNPMVTLLYLVVLGLVALQYGRVQSMEEAIYGKAKNKAFYQTAKSIVLGLFGGILASIMMVLIGVTVTDSGIQYLFPVALFLFLISPRFLCYSYAGGLASLSYLLFGWPRVNVPAIMALVASLHAAEALLIVVSGHTCATPLYLAGKEGRVVGGFNLQRFWPIPLIVLFMVKVPDISQLQGLIHLPDWWPLIRAPQTPGPGVPVFAMMPVVAALGYGDLAVSRTPREKSKYTSRNLLLFSLILLGFSIAASRFPAFAWVAAVFSPVAHEIVIRTGSKEELEGSPIYVPKGRGVMVLDVIDRSPAQESGITAGDVILSVNGVPVSSREDLNAVLTGPGPVTVEYMPSAGGAVRRVDVDRTNWEPLGLITVPELGDQPLVRPRSEGPLGSLLKKILRNITD